MQRTDRPDEIGPTPLLPKPFVDGVRGMAPVLAGLVPFGLTIGATAAGRGLGPGATAATTLGVYSGSAQLLSVELLAAGAGPLVLLVMIGIVNARMVLFSAGVRTVWRGTSGRSRALAGYLLVDPVFVLSRRRQSVDGDPVSQQQHYLGAGLTLWTGWLVANAAGYAVGGRMAIAGPIVLATPLVLLAMASGTVTSAPSLAAAVVAAVAVVSLDGLPYDLGFVCAGLSGIAAGVVTDARKHRVTTAVDHTARPTGDGRDPAGVAA
jgi:predicted branched-subunit amino acid permease